jgi:hypothetical protein
VPGRSISLIAEKQTGEKRPVCFSQQRYYIKSEPEAIYIGEVRQIIGRRNVGSF